ncbi:hypothetical protein O0Q50_23500 [Priestia aryabhattai]|uniref:Uncharacterized protein n=1 Tax=Priestia aryabhattai TaxID=412384 RepID=A0AAX6NF87_PRIAR|nr:hypothetical protein [Priestia aryabhattai]MDU9694154.1 hypothetical protein [Priestia aryabhattai]
MQYVQEELFHFLEDSSYFYEKTPAVAMQRSDDSTARERDLTHIIYTFFEQENPYQAIAEISIPVSNPSEEIKWKFIQMSEDTNKPTFQSLNPDIHLMPEWFRPLLLETQVLYEKKTILFKIFSPEI